MKFYEKLEDLRIYAIATPQPDLPQKSQAVGERDKK